jgi:hypothetical protein
MTRAYLSDVEITPQEHIDFSAPAKERSLVKTYRVASRQTLGIRDGYAILTFFVVRSRAEFAASSSGAGAT